MTKNVRLTQHYINNIWKSPNGLKGKLCINGKAFFHVPPTARAEGESYKSTEIVADPNNVPIYDLRGDILRTEIVESYGCNEGEVIIMPNAVVDSLVGIVEEVI